MEIIKNALSLLFVWTMAGCFITAVIFAIGCVVVEFVSEMFGKLFYNIGMIVGGPLMWMLLVISE